MWLVCGSGDRRNPPFSSVGAGLALVPDDETKREPATSAPFARPKKIRRGRRLLPRNCLKVALDGGRIGISLNFQAVGPPRTEPPIRELLHLKVPNHRKLCRVPVVTEGVSGTKMTPGRESRDMTKDRGVKKANCRALTKQELEKLKRNGLHPHALKPKKNGSKYDLIVCKGSGQVYVTRKKYVDKHGKIRLPNDPELDDTGINIHDLPNGNGTSNTMIIEFRLLGFAPPPELVASQLVQLGFEVSQQWQEGDRRVSELPLRHDANGVSIVATTNRYGFEQRVSALLGKLHRRRRAIQKICGPHYAELSCVLYLHGDERPSISLDRKNLDRLGDLNADVDIDLYVLD